MDATTQWESRISYVNLYFVTLVSHCSATAVAHALINYGRVTGARARDELTFDLALRWVGLVLNCPRSIALVTTRQETVRIVGQGRER